MSHANARLNHYGRGLLITRVLEEGWTAAAAAEASGVSGAKVYKWLARFRAEGPAGLRDRSSCPAHNPRHLSVRAEQRILGLRRRRKLGPHRLAALVNGHPEVRTFGQAEIRTSGHGLRCQVFGERAPPRDFASFIRNDSPSVTTTTAWCRRRSSMETAVVCSGRKVPHWSKGRWLATPRLRRS